MSRLEIVAVVVSVLGVWLTTKRSLWNFPFSLSSVALYAAIFYRVKLYADVLLQGAFAVILLYGLVQWLRGKDQKGEVIVARVTNLDPVVATLAGTIVSLTLGYILASSTDAALPWIDSCLLAASLIGSFWGARRIVEQWWVWKCVQRQNRCLQKMPRADPNMKTLKNPMIEATTRLRHNRHGTCRVLQSCVKS